MSSEPPNLSLGAMHLMSALSRVNDGIVASMARLADEFGVVDLTKLLLGKEISEKYERVAASEIAARCPNPVALFYNPQRMRIVFIAEDGVESGIRLNEARPHLFDYCCSVRAAKGLPPITEEEFGTVSSCQVGRDLVRELAAMGNDVVGVERHGDGWQEMETGRSIDADVPADPED